MCSNVRHYGIRFRYWVIDYLSWWIWYCQKEMALGNGTPHKIRSHKIELSPYRLQISRTVDGVKPERTDCGNVSADEKLNICASYSFVVIRGMQRADLTPIAYPHVGKHTKVSLTTTSSLEGEPVSNTIGRFAKENPLRLGQICLACCHRVNRPINVEISAHVPGQRREGLNNSFAQSTSTERELRINLAALRKKCGRTTEYMRTWREDVTPNQCDLRHFWPLHVV